MGLKQHNTQEFVLMSCMGVGCHSHRNYLLAMSGSNYLLVCLRGSLGALGGPWGALGEVFNPAKDPTVS